MQTRLHGILAIGSSSLLWALAACGSQTNPARPVEASRALAPVEAPSAPLPAEPEPPLVPFTPLVAIQAGQYLPMYPGKDEPKQVDIAGFSLELHPVTNAQFLRFVWENPKWQRSQIKRLFADANYLSHWPSNLSIEPSMAEAPVTNISWFAARAFAQWAGRRLPTLAEWEYVAAASDVQALGRDDPAYNQRILAWYGRPSPQIPPSVRQSAPNFYGIQDLHGLVWEWVDDFNTALVTGESRGDAGLDRNLFCGSGSIASIDPLDYAAFMRFAFRGSLQASYTVRNLGFRCAND